MERFICHPQGDFSQIPNGQARAEQNILQAFLEQIERDTQIKGLLELMNRAYDFVAAAEALQKIKARPAIIESLAQQTTECAYFLRDYAGKSGFRESAYVPTTRMCFLKIFQSCVQPIIP